MSIRSMLLPLIVLCLCAGACQEAKKEEAPVEKPIAGVVDLARVTTECEAGKAARTFLAGIQTDFSGQIEALQKSLGEDTGSEGAMQVFQALYTSLQNRLQQEDQAAGEKLINGIFKAAEAVRAEQGLKFILRSDMVIAAEKSIDVTDLVLAAVNKSIIEFKPVTGDPRTDEPTAAALKAMQEAKAKAAAEPAAPEAAPAESAATEAPAAAPEAAPAPAEPETAVPAPAEVPAADNAPEAAPAPDGAGR